MRHPGKYHLACSLILAIVAVSFFSGIWDPDFFWHLATGRWIVENGTLPAFDPFAVYADTSTERAQLVLKGYWLCQLLYYAIFSNFGYIGFAVLKAVTFVLLFMGQFWLLTKNRVGIAIATSQALIVYTELLAFRADRPQMFSNLAALLVVVLIELRHYRWLPLVMLIWANMHGGFLVGVVIIVIYAGIAIISRVRKQPGETSTIFWLLSGIACAGLNPLGFNAIKEVITLQGGDYQKSVFENISPLALAYRFHDIYWGYFLVLSLGIVLIIVLRKKIPPAQTIIFLSLSILSLSGSRYMPFLIICGSLYVALWLSPLCGKWGESRVIAAGILVFMGIICIADIRDGRGFSHGIEKGRYPEKALEFIAGAHIDGKLFCNDYWGGFVLWKSPGRHISIDGRGLSPDQYLANSAILYKHAAFEAFSASDYQVVLTSAFNLISGDNYLLWQHLLRSPAWKLVYADDSTLVFVRTAAPVNSLVNPAQIALDHALHQAISFTEKFPGTPFHWINLADIYVQRNELALAGKTMQKALEKNPNDQELISRNMLIERALHYSRQ